MCKVVKRPSNTCRAEIVYGIVAQTLVKPKVKYLEWLKQALVQWYGSRAIKYAACMHGIFLISMLRFYYPRRIRRSDNVIVYVKCVFTTIWLKWWCRGSKNYGNIITPSITTHLSGNLVLCGSHTFFLSFIHLIFRHLPNKFSCISPSTLPVIQHVIRISYTKITHSIKPMGATVCHLGNLRQGISFTALYIILHLRTSNVNSINWKW